MAWLLPVMVLGQAQLPPVGNEPQKTIIDLAFDPADYARFRPIVSIRYLGDDYAYPVYAIAINRECRGEPNCETDLIARMVRSPNFKKMERPR